MTQEPVLQNIIEFIEFVQRENPNLDEMSQFAVIRTFNFLGATAMYGATLDSKGVIRPIGQYGFSAEVMKSWETPYAESATPTADALKTNNIVWLADKTEWNSDYPHLTILGQDLTNLTCIAWPITVRGSYLSALSICLDKEIAPTPMLISFLETIGGIVALQLSRQHLQAKVESNQEQPHSGFGVLTRRQREVMSLIVDGLTNIQIANELGYSESTIRQETMRIYEVLGATGRSDAIRMYREKNN
jgi:DNA-binding CsgD family transcriptional regulator